MRNTKIEQEEIIENEEGVVNVEMKQSVFKKTMNFFKRNKKKIIIGGSVIATAIAGVFVYKKLQNDSVVDIISDSEEIIDNIEE